MEPKTSGSYNFDIQTPPGFGIPKCAICFSTNGSANNDEFDESTPDRAFGIGFIGYSYANPATLTSYNCGIGFTHAGTAGTQAKAVSGSLVTGRIAYENRTDRAVIRQCNMVSIGVDRLTVNLVWTNPATSYFDLVFIFFGGDIQANIGLLSLSTTLNGTASATGLSYSPDVVFTMGSGFGFTGGNADGRLTFGCATKSDGIKNSASFFRMRSNAIGSSGLASTTVEQYVSTDSCFIMSTAFQNNLVRANVTSFNSDGFTVTSQTAGFLNGTTNGLLYLAIKGLSPDHFNLQNFSSSTSTGLSAIATSNFTPQLLIGALSSVTSTGATVISNDSTGLSLFAVKSSTSKNYYSTGTITVSNGSTSVTGSGTGFSRLNVGDVILSSTNSVVGVVSEVANSTSLFLKENSPINLSSDNFSYRPYDQFSVTIGSSNLSTQTKIASSVSQNSIKIVKFGAAAGISTVVSGAINNFDSYPGLKINYSTVDASPRKGWFLAIKDTQLRRRDSN